MVVSPEKNEYPSLQLPPHHQRIDITLRRMVKSPWERTRYLESKPLPKVYSALIGGDDQIKLHRPKALGPRRVQRVFAHRTGDTTAWLPAQ